MSDRARRVPMRRNSHASAAIVLGALAAVTGGAAIIAAMPLSPFFAAAMLALGLVLRRRDRRRHPLGRGERRITPGHWLVLASVVVVAIELATTPFLPFLALLALWIAFERRRAARH